MPPTPPIQPIVPEGSRIERCTCSYADTSGGWVLEYAARDCPHHGEKCVCDPTTEGPLPWCDVHGQPSAAYDAGRRQALQEFRDFLSVMEPRP